MVWWPTDKDFECLSVLFFCKIESSILDKSIIDLLLSTSGPKEKRNALVSNLLFLMGDRGGGEVGDRSIRRCGDSQR